MVSHQRRALLLWETSTCLPSSSLVVTQREDRKQSAPASPTGLPPPPTPSVGASLVAQLVKHLPAMRETWVRSLVLEDPLEKGKATHSSILAWRIPWTIQSQRVGHDCAPFTSLHSINKPWRNQSPFQFSSLMLYSLPRELLLADCFPFLFFFKVNLTFFWVKPTLTHQPRF